MSDSYNYGLGPWGTAVRDQIEAAIAQDDWGMVAKLAIDGFLQAVEIDNNGRSQPFEKYVAAVSHMGHDALVLWCAEACRRLYELRIARG